MEDEDQGKRYFMNVMESEHGMVLSICDSDLIGKVIEEGDRILDLTCPFFSNGKEKNFQDIIKHIYVAHTVNIVGTKIVGRLISEGILKEEEVMSIKGVKYSHIYRV